MRVGAIGSWVRAAGLFGCAGGRAELCQLPPGELCRRECNARCIGCCVTMCAACFVGLGVPPDVEELDLRKAYLRLALDHHPDKGGDR
jgi:hypothetical protein